MEPKYVKFKEFFDEHIPFEPKSTNGKLAHHYTVELSRAIFDDECFEVWKRYEKSIHKKQEKKKHSYENFLCQSPLYDPNNPADIALPYFDSDYNDDFREYKDEGLFP